MARRIYLIALTIDVDRLEPLDLNEEASLDQEVESCFEWSSAREAIDTALGSAESIPAQLVGLMVVGRIPTYPEG